MKPTASKISIAQEKFSSNKQNFSLPSTIMYYILKNPSTSKCYSKLTQTCKYFFYKNPLLVIHRISNGIICPNDIHQRVYGVQKCCPNFDIKNFKHKIWLANDGFFLDEDNKDPKIISTICSKIYRCDISRLLLHYNGIISYNDFKLLTVVAKNVELFDIKIMYSNNENEVALEKIIGTIPNIRKFKYCFDKSSPAASRSTIKNISKLTSLRKLKQFALYRIPEICNVNHIRSLLEVFKRTKFSLFFNINIPQYYKKQLDALVDDLIKSKARGRLIWYDGHDTKKYQILDGL